MKRFRLGLGRTFQSLRVRNYRLYFFGQAISVAGTWLQIVAEGWLVYQLTHDFRPSSVRQPAK